MAAATLDLPEIGSFMTEGYDVAKLKIDSQRRLHIFPKYRRVEVKKTVSNSILWGSLSDSISGIVEYSYIDPFQQPPKEEDQEPFVFEVLIPGVYMMERTNEMPLEKWNAAVAKCEEIYDVKFVSTERNAMALYDRYPYAPRVVPGTYCFFRVLNGNRDDYDLIRAINENGFRGQSFGIAVQMKPANDGELLYKERRGDEDYVVYALARSHVGFNFTGKDNYGDAVGIRLFSLQGAAEFDEISQIGDAMKNIGGFSIPYTQYWIDAEEPTHRIYMQREHNSIFSIPSKETFDKHGGTIYGSLPNSVPIIS